MDNGIIDTAAIVLKEGDFDEVVTLFDQLIAFLETNNWDAEDYLEQVNAHLGDTHGQEINRIKHHLADLEFEAAADRVRKLKERLHSPLILKS